GASGPGRRGNAADGVAERGIIGQLLRRRGLWQRVPYHPCPVLDDQGVVGRVVVDGVGDVPQVPGKCPRGSRRRLGSNRVGEVAAPGGRRDAHQAVEGEPCWELICDHRILGHPFAQGEGKTVNDRVADAQGRVVAGARWSGPCIGYHRFGESGRIEGSDRGGGRTGTIVVRRGHIRATGAGTLPCDCAGERSPVHINAVGDWGAAGCQYARLVGEHQCPAGRDVQAGVSILASPAQGAVPQGGGSQYEPTDRGAVDLGCGRVGDQQYIRRQEVHDVRIVRFGAPIVIDGDRIPEDVARYGRRGYRLSRR